MRMTDEGKAALGYIEALFILALIVGIVSSLVVFAFNKSKIISSSKQLQTVEYISESISN